MSMLDEILKLGSARNISWGKPSCKGSNDSVGRLWERLGRIEH